MGRNIEIHHVVERGEGPPHFIYSGGFCCRHRYLVISPLLLFSSGALLSQLRYRVERGLDGIGGVPAWTPLMPTWKACRLRRGRMHSAQGTVYFLTYIFRNWSSVCCGSVEGLAILAFQRNVVPERTGTKPAPARP